MDKASAHNAPGAGLAVPRSQRRLQFSLLSLFLLTTLTCLLLSWWVWPRPIEVVSIVNASATPLPVSRSVADGTPPEFAVYQQELLKELRSPGLLQDAVSVPGNGNLGMFRNRSEPTEWLAKRLRVEVVQPATIMISLKVPEHLRDEGVEVVDYITTKCVSRTTVKVGRQTREYLSDLRAEQQRVRRQLRKNTRQLAQLSRTRSADDAEIIALETEVLHLTDTIKRLVVEIQNAQTADNSSQYLQLVQMATAVSN